MKFLNKITDKYLSLDPMAGCSFWSDKLGNVYEVDEGIGTCYPKTAKNAVESILARKSMKNEEPRKRKKLQF